MNDPASYVGSKGEVYNLAGDLVNHDIVSRDGNPCRGCLSYKGYPCLVIDCRYNGKKV